MTEKHNPIVQALLDRGESVEYAEDALVVMVDAVVNDGQVPFEVLCNEGLSLDYYDNLVDACEQRVEDSRW